MPQNPESRTEIFEPKIEHKGNITTITKPEGRYSFIYGQHWHTHPPEKLPENIDGFFFERGHRYDINPYDLMPRRKADDLENRNFFEKFETNRTPIYFYDVDIKYPALHEFGIRPAMLILELYLGSTLLSGVYKELKKRQLSRGDFLKTGLKAAAGLWAVSGPAMVPDTLVPGGSKERKIFLRMKEKLHPELNLLILTYRNAVMAHKIQWLAEQMQKPHFAGTLGSGHLLIEDQILKSPQQRLEFLKKVTPLLKPFIEPQSFYLMRRFDFDGQNWQHSKDLEMPELREIIEGKGKRQLP